MNPMREVFNIVPFSYLWHTKRAIKFEMSDLREKESSRITEAQEEELLQLLAVHYNTHVYLCPRKSVGYIR